MSGQGIGQILVYAGALIVLGYPLGMYMARVYTNEGFATGGWLRWLGATERGFYRLIGTNGRKEQDWKGYAKTTIVFTSSSSGCSTRSSACRHTCS